MEGDGSTTFEGDRVNILFYFINHDTLSLIQTINHFQMVIDNGSHCHLYFYY